MGGLRNPVPVAKYFYFSFQEKPFTLPETSAMFAKPNSRRNKLPNTSAGSIVNRKIPTGGKNFFMPPSKNLFPCREQWWKKFIGIIVIALVDTG